MCGRAGRALAVFGQLGIIDTGGRLRLGEPYSDPLGQSSGGRLWQSACSFLSKPQGGRFSSMKADVNLGDRDFD